MLIIIICIFVFEMSADMVLLCLCLNGGLKILDEVVFFPKLWIRKKIRIKPASKEEKEQSELYEEVSKAREKYHELNKKYMKAFNGLTLEDENAYLEYLNSLDIPLDIEEENKSVKEQGSTVDTKIYAKINEDK